MQTRVLIVGVLMCLYHFILNSFRYSSLFSKNEIAHHFLSQSLHTKCRNSVYPSNSSIVRFAVPNEKVSWATKFPEYTPLDYTHPSVYTASWADPDIQKEKKILLFNQIDGLIDRTSYPHPYDIGEDGLPRNPRGRTGIIGRGSLGRWGPNHAADPIVTRWKVDSNGEQIVHSDSGKRILQFVAIKRRDANEWAIPGGMVDAGESVSTTLKREFSEEALSSLEASGFALENIRSQVQLAFDSGTEVYRGYVDDPRNTDNAWMETVAVNFHDEFATSLAKFHLSAGDDAVAVRWVDVTPKLQLYASHIDFIELVAKLRDAFWLDQ